MVVNHDVKEKGNVTIVLLVRGNGEGKKSAALQDVCVYVARVADLFSGTLRTRTHQSVVCVRSPKVFSGRAQCLRDNTRSAWAGKCKGTLHRCDVILVHVFTYM